MFSRRSFQFTTLDLLVWMTVVAIVLGVLSGIHRGMHIDPESESVETQDGPISLTWKYVPWESPRSGPHDGSPSFQTPGGCGGGVTVSEDDTLFRLAYSNYFGQRTYAAKPIISLHRDEEWTCYILRLHVVGGGTTDGGTILDYAFEAATKRLRVNIEQRINSKRLAKKAVLFFRHDGSRFRLEETTDQGE